MIEVKNLCFGYIKQPLCLKDVSFKVNKGETVLLLGGKGMGKISLLRVLCGLEKQYFGQVLINGKDVRDMSLEERNISYLPAEPVLLDKKSLLENIKYLFKVQNKECLSEQELIKIFEKFNFNFDLKTKIKKLSLCYKKVFSIIRCYIKNPEIVLIDDLVYNETEENSTIIKNAIFRLKQLKSNKISLIYTSGKQNSLVNADKCFYLSFSKLIEISSVEMLKNSPVDLFSTAYFDCYQKQLKVEKYNSQYYLIDFEVLVNKKAQTINELRRVKLDDKFAQTFDKEMIGEGQNYDVVLVSFNEYNFDELSDEIISKNLSEKKMFLFMGSTGSLIEI